MFKYSVLFIALLYQISAAPTLDIQSNSTASANNQIPTSTLDTLTISASNPTPTMPAAPTNPEILTAATKDPIAPVPTQTSAPRQATPTPNGLDLSSYYVSSLNKCVVSKSNNLDDSETVPTTGDAGKYLCLPGSVIDQLTDNNQVAPPLAKQIHLKICIKLTLFVSSNTQYIACNKCIPGFNLNTDSKFCISNRVDLCASGSQWDGKSVTCPGGKLADHAVLSDNHLMFICAKGFALDGFSKPAKCVPSTKN